MASETLVAGRYRPVERVGAGSMGEVWRAHDERLHRDVALKLLDLSAAPDPTTAERFRREAVATAQFNHPNIVSVFDAGTDGNRAYLVMTLLPGRTIAELVRTEGPMPLDRALSLVTQVTSALREAHRHGLVHRDVKPANVIVNGNKATVVDFGIAQLSGLGAALTATYAVIGSAAYMSPEHATGLRAGPASDLYGVGCLLMTMLTGQPPFTGESAVAVATQQVSAEPPALSERIRTPRALDHLVSSLLAKDPAARPDAESALEQLSNVQAHPTSDLIGPTPRIAPLATKVLPAATAVLPSTVPRPTKTTLMPVAPVAPAPAIAQPWSPPGPPFTPVAPMRPTAPPTTPATRAPVAIPQPTRKGRILRPLLWLVLLVLLGGVAYLLGTQAGAVTALLQTPLPASSSRVAPTSASPTASAKPGKPTTTSAAPTASGTAMALQLTVQGVSQVLAGLPAGNSKDRLVADWSTTGAAVLRGDHPNDQLDRFAAKVQKEVRNGDVSIPQGMAILGAVETVR
ncbi:MAG TPA: serine/threonine-protein kinase, partial [Pengzhenrongella sp.]